MPVEEYSLAHLRDAVAMVLQKNTLFSGSLRENLLWGNPEAPDEELLRACRIARVDEFLDRLENGLDTEMGQGGSNISGGQKQRICIARAAISRPPVLILDEAHQLHRYPHGSSHRERHGCPYGEPDGFRHRSPAFHSEKFQGHPGSGKGKDHRERGSSGAFGRKRALLSVIYRKSGAGLKQIRIFRLVS